MICTLGFWISEEDISVAAISGDLSSIIATVIIIRLCQIVHTTQVRVCPDVWNLVQGLSNQRPRTVIQSTVTLGVLTRYGGLK
jgi:hypothetical protein